MEILIAAITEAIFSIILHDLMQNPIFEKLRDRLRGPSPEKMAFQKSLISAFYVFSQEYPALSSSLFDEYFIKKPEVLTELSKILYPNLNPNIEILEKAWRSQFPLSEKEDISAPLSFFVSTLQNELKKQPQLRPFFDSRALEQLYSLVDQSYLQTEIQLQIRDIAQEIKLLIQQNPLENMQSTKGSQPTSIEPVLSKLPENFPDMQIPLVGRNREVSQIVNILNDPKCRLISLVGPGGIGKTSIAIEVAKTVRENYKNGTLFLSLLSVNSAELILSSLAAEARIALFTYKDTFSQITDYFKDKQALLILDNFEHLVPDGGKIITTILERTPDDVKLVITTRQRLNIQHEWAIEIDGLGFPRSLETHETVNSLLQYHAIQLFINLARKVNLNFNISEENAFDIAKICQLVEGLPLGIELAASGTKALDCKGIVQGIESSMDFLGYDARSTSARHRSLRAVFEQSWGHLTATEKTIYAKLSVFRGSFHLDAAAYVADATLESLADLIDKSLITIHSGRYQILEVLNQYAKEKLLDDPRVYEVAKNKHCDYYLNLLAQKKIDLKADRQNHAVQVLGREIGNISDAWNWAINQQNYLLINNAIESLFLYYEYRGAIEEAENLVSNARMNFNDASVDSGDVLGRLLRFQARLSHIFSKNEDALNYYHESLQVLMNMDPAIRDQKEIAQVLVGLGAVSYTLGEYAEAEKYFLESAILGEELDDHELMAATSMRLGDIASVLGDYDNAKQLLEKSVRILEKINNPRRLALGLSNVADIQCKLGAYDEAEYLFKRSLELSLSLNDHFVQGVAEVNLGRVYFIKGNFGEAESYCRSGRENFVKVHHEWGIAFAINHLAKGLIKMGRLDGALELCFENIENCRRHENPWNLAFTHINIGNIYRVRNIMEKAMDSFRDSAKLSTEIQVEPLFIDALLGISLVLKTQGLAEKSIDFLQVISKCPFGDMQTQLEAQELLVSFQQEGYYVNTDLVHKDWKAELDRLREELENPSNFNQ